jgi:hypothetical protein
VDLILFVELQMLDPLEALLQMWLDSLGVTRLLEDGEEVLIAEKEEAWEEQALGFQVLAELLVDDLKLLVRVD